MESNVLNHSWAKRVNLYLEEKHINKKIERRMKREDEDISKIRFIKDIIVVLSTIFIVAFVICFFIVNFNKVKNNNLDFAKNKTNDILADSSVIVCEAESVTKEYNEEGLADAIARYVYPKNAGGKTLSWYFVPSVFTGGRPSSIYVTSGDCKTDELMLANSEAATSFMYGDKFNKSEIESVDYITYSMQSALFHTVLKIFEHDPYECGPALFVWYENDSIS